MPEKETRSLAKSVQRYVVAGIFTVIPLWITWLVVELLFSLLAKAGAPTAAWVSQALRPYAPWLADVLAAPWLRSALAVVLALAALVGLGWVATNVAGRRLIRWFDALMERIPLVRTVYSSVRKLIAALQQQPEGVQRVVLIDFPSPEMKTVGLVTRTITDEDTGRQLAAVYVPTTPNPTSGYLEIVPIERITPTNWTVEEAMTFIVSGGAVAPAKMSYDRGATAPAEPAPKEPARKDAAPKRRAPKEPAAKKPAPKRRAPEEATRKGPAPKKRRRRRRPRQRPDDESK